MSNTTSTKKRIGRPRSTHFQAVQNIVRNCSVNTKTGRIYNRRGIEIGGATYEPRVTVHLDGKKYNARINKVVGFVVFGPEALRRGVSVRHINGDKYDNRAKNLELVYNRAAQKAYNRLMRTA